MINLDNSIKFKGSVTFEKVYKDTGEREIVFNEDPNIIVNNGGRMMLFSIVPEEYEVNDGHLEYLKFGDDIGDTEDIYSPVLPDRDFDGSEQDVVWEEDIDSFSAVTDYSFTILTSLKTEDIFDELNIEETLRLNSVTLWTNKDKLFAFKRFPAVYLTFGVDLNIEWKIEWVSE